jgi:hypothetical protein
MHFYDFSQKYLASYVTLKDDSKITIIMDLLKLYNLQV